MKCFDLEKPHRGEILVANKKEKITDGACGNKCSK